MRLEGVHHVGILVRDAAAVAERLSAGLGLQVSSWEEYGPGLLRIAFIPVGSVLVELIEPLTEDGFNAEWLRTRGEGIQHIALEVGDIHLAMQELKRRGVPLQDDTPQPGAGNTLITFLPQALTGGFLIELTQPLPVARGSAENGG